uniref:coiled-coil domain-containing protein 71-like n=1 Tax=Oncorhynchus gorbuscha TaxID=8017 RepID=UPI001EAEBE61|nr:coiled-coil domain-containing protein 71-like [Oncorhynchus gorbuscha]
MVYAMNCKEAAEKVVLSWSRFTSAGQTTLLETLKAFSPMSDDLFDSEKELATFIEGLKDEGHKPTVLKSKDVYGYRSCTSVLRPLVKTQSTLDIATSKVKKTGKKKSRKPLDKNTEINYALLSAAAKVVLKNQPKILLTNLSKESLKQTVLSKPPDLAVGPVQMQSYIRLTNIIGPSTGHTARLQFHTGVVRRGNGTQLTSATISNRDTSTAFGRYRKLRKISHFEESELCALPSQYHWSPCSCHAAQRPGFEGMQQNALLEGPENVKD